MTVSTVDIRPFDPKGASDDEYAAHYRYITQIRAERQPDRPPVSYEHAVADMKNIPPIVDVHIWAAWDGTGTEIVGTSSAAIMTTGDNEHLVQCEVTVLPAYRGQGIGKALFTKVVRFAEQLHRRLLIMQTEATVPAGREVLEHVGATVGLAQHTNELELSEVDRTLMQRWQERASERAAGFEMGVWEGPPYPESEIETVAKMQDAMNTVPMDDLDIEHFHFSTDQVREMDAAAEARGMRRWTIYVRERSSGNIAGYTEIEWRESQPEIAFQGLTAVFPEYRNLGLGRWLKAAMIEKVLTEQPAIKRVITGNADSNAAMLSINNEMGFKSKAAAILWQLDLERAVEHLNG